MTWHDAVEKWQVTIVIVMNCYVEGSKATTYVVPGHTDQDDNAIPPYEENSGAINLLGPVEVSIAEKVATSTSLLMQQLGFDVHRDVTADD